MEISIKKESIKAKQLITKSEYAKLKNVSAPYITKICREGKLNLLKIKGTELIILEK